jgi:hypothetical protein
MVLDAVTEPSLAIATFRRKGCQVQDAIEAAGEEFVRGGRGTAPRHFGNQLDNLTLADLVQR